jgi:hypothetical protein
MTTAIAELEAAVTRLRDDRNCSGYRVDCNSRELLDMIRVLLRSRASLADWLEHEITRYDPAAGIQETDGSHRVALAVARAVNGPAQPGHALGGLIVDHQRPILPA